MARALIQAGICGFKTIVEAHLEGEDCVVSIESECKSIQKLAGDVCRLDPFREITFRGQGPQILSQAAKRCPHTACPVPSGIIKAVEVASGLALPADASIHLEK
ncbi:MAG TPA: hypothetical protein VIO61_13695 [Anaerolineaceae bacterium]